MALGVRGPGSAAPGSIFSHDSAPRRNIPPVVSQLPRSVGQWAALTWLVMRPAASTTLDRGIEPSDFLPQGSGPRTFIHMFVTFPRDKAPGVTCALSSSPRQQALTTRSRRAA